MMATASGNIVSFKSANLNYPRDGVRVVPLDLDFTSSPNFVLNFTALLADKIIDQVQSVFIDNSDNTTAVDIYFDGAPRSQRIRCEAYSQGLFPVTMPEQSGRMHANTAGGVVVPIILYNIPMPYYTSGPADGALVVPPLANSAIDLAPALIGDNTLIPGVLGQSTRLYRMLLTFGGNTIIQFWNGPSAGALKLSGAIQMYQGGSFFLPPSGVPWWSMAAGNDLVMSSTAAVNIGGMEGFIQS